MGLPERHPAGLDRVGAALTPAEQLLEAIPPGPVGVLLAELPRLTGLDELAVALGVAALFSEGLVRCYPWAGASFVARAAS